MSLRGLWVLSLPGMAPGKLIVSRVFPTVEKRAKLCDADHYTAVPDGEGMAAALFAELGLHDGSHIYVNSQDSCNKYDQKPVFSVPVLGGRLWPVLVAEQYGLLYCCLPLVEQGSHNKPPLAHIAGLSTGFSLLLGMADFLGPLPRVIDETSSKFSELHLFIGEAAPLGTPLDTVPFTVRLALQGRYSPSPARQAQKQPAWRPQQYKGKPHLHFTIREHIRARQYDEPAVSDVWDVYATVTCKAELEGTIPEVTLTLGKEEDLTATPMDHLLVHPCVQSVEPQGLSEVHDDGARMSTCRLRFTPPLEMFSLCHYTANRLSEPPIQGFYQMKGEKTVEVLIQLKLTHHMKNSFEYCELQLPFHHRGPILNHESAPNHGSVLLSPDKKVLVWNIGQKFPSRTLEVLLKSTIYFGKYGLPAPETASAEETICSGQNCFAQLFFKISDFTMSGVTIDAKSIQVSPNVKYKLTFGREFISTDYKIWNSHGDSPVAYQPSPHLLAKIQNIPYR